MVLNFPEMLLDHSLRSLTAAVPLVRRFPRSFVALDNDVICASLTARPSPVDFRWDIESLDACRQGSLTSESAVVDTWIKLLEFAVWDAGSAGAKRLRAASPLDGPAHTALLRAGFTVYGHRNLLLARGLRPGEHEDIRVRPQEPSDEWSLHHLYHLTTPRVVQYAEAFTSQHWAIGRKNRARVSGYVVDGEFGIAAYCQVRSRGRQAVVQVMTHEDAIHLLATLLPQAIQRSGLGSGASIWVSIPDYHQEYQTVLSEIGFTQVDRQALMIRNTTAPAWTTAVKWAPVTQEGSERLPARLPSYSKAH